MCTGFFLSSQFTKKREGRHSSKIRFYKERDSPTFIKLPTLVRALPVPPERDRRTRGPISIIPQIPIVMRVRHKHPNINPLPILTLPIYIYIKGETALAYTHLNVPGWTASAQMCHRHGAGDAMSRVPSARTPARPRKSPEAAERMCHPCSAQMRFHCVLCARCVRVCVCAVSGEIACVCVV